MSLKTFVKIANISNLSDARYCAGMMVDVLGFNLEEGTEGYINPEQFKEITEWVAGVKFAGEFTNALPAEVKLAVDNYDLDFIEVCNVDLLEELSSLSKPLILKLIIDDYSQLGKLEAQINYASEFVEYIILDLLNTEWEEELRAKLNSPNAHAPLIRAYNVDELTAVSITEDSKFYGIQLEATPEDRPGFKDYGEVMDILEVLEED